jgi:hypothetical protein
MLGLGVLAGSARTGLAALQADVQMGSFSTGSSAEVSEPGINRPSSDSTPLQCESRSSLYSKTLSSA